MIFVSVVQVLWETSFLVYLMLFGGRIGDLCNGCFDGDFTLLGVVRVGVIDPTCVFCLDYNIDLFPFTTCCRAGAW